MSRRAFTTAEKTALAQGWAVARADGETQDAYARRHGTTARRIREYVADFGQPVDITAEARRIIDEAMRKLKRLEQRLVSAAAEGVAETPAAPLPAPQSAPPRLAVVDSGVPVCAPRRPFQWDLD